MRGEGTIIRFEPTCCLGVLLVHQMNDRPKKEAVVEDALVNVVLRMLHSEPIHDIDWPRLRRGHSHHLEIAKSPLYNFTINKLSKHS